MKIDDAISHCEDIIKDSETCEACRQEHEQLKEWLTICSCVINGMTKCSITNIYDDDTAEIEIKTIMSPLAKASELQEMMWDAKGAETNSIKKDRQKLSNRDRVLEYCKTYRSTNVDDLIERDDVECRIRKYPEDKDDWFYGCPHHWGLPEFEEKELCNFGENDEAFKVSSRSALHICSKCWNLALKDGDAN